MDHCKFLIYRARIRNQQWFHMCVSYLTDFARKNHEKFNTVDHRKYMVLTSETFKIVINTLKILKQSFDAVRAKKFFF